MTRHDARSHGNTPSFQKIFSGMLLLLLAPSVWASIPVYVGSPAGWVYEGDVNSVSDLLGPHNPQTKLKMVKLSGDGDVPMYFLSDSQSTCATPISVREQAAIDIFQSAGDAPIVWSFVQVTLADGNIEAWTRSGGVPAAQHYWVWNAGTCP